MAPWSSRTSPPNSHSQHGLGTATSNAAPPTKSRLPSRVTESDILDNAYGIPTLHPPGSSNSRAPRPSGHGRSLSHPFTLFHGKKKRHGENANGFESTDEDLVSPSQARQISQNPSTKHGKLLEKELLTGKCMTCDSMVRWPKNLSVFRCTVCMTINDLKPVVLEARRGDGHRVAIPLGKYTSSNPQKGGHSHNPSLCNTRLINLQLLQSP